MFKKLFKSFESAGEELFYVGGYVRDKLINDIQTDPVLGGNPLERLNFKPNDVDFATSALPQKTIEILKENGLKAIPIGIEFGTIQTIIDDMKVEITTYRCDESYKKGSRKPSVKFGKSIKEDLARRDFTINAIAMREDGMLIDPFYGHADLIQGLIHTPIHPHISFSDDPLRMLRACRFHARKHCGKLGWETGRAMMELAHKIKEVSAERIFEEMSKILMADEPVEGLKVMVDNRLMAQVFPEIQKVVDFKNDQGKWHSKNVWDHTLGVVENSPPILEVRWAALFHDVAKPQTYSETGTGVHFYQHDWKGALVWEQVGRRLKVSNEFRDHVSLLIYEHMQPSLMTDSKVSKKGLRRLARRLGDKLDNLFHLSVADITSHNPERVRGKREACMALKERIIEVLKEEDIVRLKLPKGTGLVVMKATGMKPGPELGKLLRHLEQGVIDGELSVDDDFGAIAKDIMEDLERECYNPPVEWSEE